MNSNIRRSWWLLTLASMGGLLLLTLRPDNTPNQINWIPLAEHGQALACLVNRSCASPEAFRFLFIDVLGNILVFVPLGLGLAGIGQRTNDWQTVQRAALVGLLFSLTIEISQLAIPSRATDVDDLIFNTLGVIVGALLFILARQKNLFPSDS
jgi:glycopeptide antibiotics resistance protein